MVLHRVVEFGYSVISLAADPVGGSPQAPGGDSQKDVDGLWSNGLWWFAVICAFALLCTLAVWAFAQINDRPTDGFGKAATILGVCVAAGAVPSVIGAITGT